METITNDQQTVQFTFSFDDEARKNLSMNDQEKIRNALIRLVISDAIAVRLKGLDIAGDVFLARVGKIKAIQIERDGKLINRLGYIDRRNQSDGKNLINCGIWKVIPGSGSEAFRLYW
jgi:hypothetical protein